MKKKGKGLFAPACVGFCGHALRRFHFTCLFCRHRRLAYGKVRRGRFRRGDLYYRLVYSRSGALVVPAVAVVYVLVIDEGRRFYWVKARLLKALLTVAELLAN